MSSIAVMGASIRQGARRAGSALSSAKKTASDPAFWFGSLATEDWGKESIGDAFGRGGSLREEFAAITDIQITTSREGDNEGSFGTKGRLKVSVSGFGGGFGF